MYKNFNFSTCYQIGSVLLLTAYKINTHRWKKIAFNQNASNLARWWTEHPPPAPANYLQGFCLAVKAFKGRQGSNLDNHRFGGQSRHHSPLCAGLSAPWGLSLDVIVFTQFCPTVQEITEGEARGEILSSVTYLFFISSSLIYRKNQ